MGGTIWQRLLVYAIAAGLIVARVSSDRFVLAGSLVVGFGCVEAAIAWRRRRRRAKRRAEYADEH